MITWTTIKKRISELTDYEHNPRAIKTNAFEKLVESIKQDGYHGRIVINTDGTIIGGHQRKHALLQAGYKLDDEIEVLVPSRTLSTEEFDRLNIRDNLPYGEFDWDILGNRFETDTLLDWGMPEEWLPNMVKDIEAMAADGSENNVPTVPDEPTAKIGDIYQLGRHRVMCGDSTNPQHVEKLLDGNEPIAMITDPPYGVNYDPQWREDADGIGGRSLGKVANDDIVDWTDAYSLFAGSVIYVWHAGKFSDVVARNIKDCGFDIISQIIWAKNHFAISRGDYHWKHEPCWYAVRSGHKHNWQGARDQSTVWEIDNNNGTTQDKEQTWGHGTQKPIDCMERPILNNTKAGESVYDPFGGSGTTLIACERTGRNCFTMEIEPKYVDVIVKRWELFTGESAKLVSL